MLDLWLSLEVFPVVKWVNKTPLNTSALGIVSFWLLEFFKNYKEYKLSKLLTNIKFASFLIFVVSFVLQTW